MTFQTGSEGNGVKAVKAVNGIPQGLVILFFDEDRVIGVVNSLNVQLKTQSAKMFR